jgi:hypothetical protein
MDLTTRSLTRTLAALLTAAALAVGLQAHEGVATGADLYRYTPARSGAAADCAYDYVELGAAGQTLRLTARPGAEADDGAAVLALQRPFELYQSARSTLVVSGNGYLAAAASLDEDDGSDFSNDCPIPERADNPQASQDRIYVYHDDLRPRRDGGGQVRQAFFERCPRPGALGTPQPCTVVEWNGFERSGPLLSTQPLRAQAVLYHGSHEVALQYATLDDSRAASATVGLQGLGGRTASAAGCDTLDTVRARTAVCFFDPRQARSTGGRAGR